MREPWPPQARIFCSSSYDVQIGTFTHTAHASLERQPPVKCPAICRGGFASLHSPHQMALSSPNQLEALVAILGEERLRVESTEEGLRTISVEVEVQLEEEHTLDIEGPSPPADEGASEEKLFKKEEEGELPSPPGHPSLAGSGAAGGGDSTSITPPPPPPDVAVSRKPIITGVRYLPPLTLHITLPPLYPLQDAPILDLSCAWLDQERLDVIRACLKELWESTYQGGPVVFSYIEWLQHDLLKALGVGMVLQLRGPPPNTAEGETWESRLLGVSEGSPLPYLMKHERVVNEPGRGRCLALPIHASPRHKPRF